MATKYWKGDAPTVVQNGTVQITGYSVATTYKITINGVTVSVLGSGGTVNTVATALAAACGSSNHPYFQAITFTTDTDKVVLTANVAGVPFIATPSVTGGAGTIGAYTAVDAATGPNHWSEAKNWSDGVVPITGDTVTIRTGSSILWGIAQSAVTLAKLVVEKTFTGHIGHDYAAFAQRSDGDTYDSTVHEYRDIYLAISATICDIGQYSGPAIPVGSQRLLFNFGSNAATVQIFGTHQTPLETGKQAVRILANHASTDIYVYSAVGGVGIATDKPGETSTIRKVSVSDQSTSTKVILGDGVTLATWEQGGGTNIIRSAAAVGTVRINGGVLYSYGDFSMTSVEQNGGTFYSDHISSGTASAIVAITVNDGTLDGLRSSRARTWTTVTWNKGSVRYEAGVVTIGSLVIPSKGKNVLTAQPIS